MKGKQTPRSSIHVLPAEGGQDTWPVVMGRLLFAVFGGNDPAIHRLYLSNEHDQIPDDFVECWATCFWCFQACLQASLSPKEKARIRQYILPIASYAYRMTLPTSAELLSDDVISIIEGMNNRYAGNLGIMPGSIISGHRSLVGRLFEAPQEAALSSS